MFRSDLAETSSRKHYELDLINRSNILTKKDVLIYLKLKITKNLFFVKNYLI